MIKYIVGLAALLAVGAYFSGVFAARAPEPAVASTTSSDAPWGEDTSSRAYSDDECQALKDRMTDANLGDPELRERPGSFGQALSQTAKAVTRLKKMENELRRHDCLKPGNGAFTEPRAEMKPADPEPSPTPSFGSGESFGGASN
jgi:hypothetical protein